MLSAPEVLIAFRAACAPAIFVLACFRFPGPLLAGILVAAFVSDVLDGIVARHLGCATPGLRQADTLADTAFYAAAGVALWVAVPGVFDAAALPLGMLIVVHVSRTTFELTKYGRIASYHMWSSKVLGVLIVATMTIVLLTGRPSALVLVVLWTAIANELEGFFASVVLPAWTTDVPSGVHAFKMTRPA